MPPRSSSPPPLSDSIITRLRSLYEDAANSPVAFGSASALYAAARKRRIPVSRSQILRFLSHYDSHSLLYTKRLRQSPTFAAFKDEKWQVRPIQGPLFSTTQ